MDKHKMDRELSHNKIRVLAINPGSTSTKIALFDDYDVLFRKVIKHNPEDLRDFPEFQDQLGLRTAAVEKAMIENRYAMEDVDVYVGRGGGLTSVVGGVYIVCDLLAKHASTGLRGQHPAQLGVQIAKRFADKSGKPALVVNPPDVDEFIDIARVSGLNGIYRQSHLHALNQKEIALRLCAGRGLKYEDLNFIVCHIGGGISITAHERGRMIDSNDIIMGSGPMTPTRAGDMPFANIVDLAFSGEYTKEELVSKLNTGGGLADHFGTSDVRDVLDLIEKGDAYAKIILDGMIYQNAKYVGAMAVALKGKVDTIILTGGIANSKYFANSMKEYIHWIAEVVVMPGEFELEAMAAGAVRVMRGEEAAKTYTGVPVWDGFDN